MAKALALFALVLALMFHEDSAGRGRAMVATPEPLGPARTERPYVRIEREDGRFVYRVDGVPRVLRGMGYNVLHLRRGLGPAEREQRLRADFEFLRSIGVNTIQSWEDPEVDGLHLDLAAEYGLDVILYYHFPRGDDYADPAVQEHHRQQVLGWMETWRDHPAVVMWGIGNETLLSSTCETGQSFVRFYAGLVPAALAADPGRPVIYREAEDVLAPCFRDAFAQGGGPPDQFVYGMNFYTFRLAEVLDSWGELGFDVPLVLSEFAPLGAPPAQRPEGFRRLWGVIEAHNSVVLGGAPYTWTTEGPEATDHLFGLVDGNNHPRDRSLVVLSELWGGVYGKPGSSWTTVPDLVGLDMPAARAAAYQEGFDIRVREVRVRGAPRASAIRRQTPRAGQLAPRGSTVRLSVPGGAPSVPEARDRFEVLAGGARSIVLEATGETPEDFDARHSATEAQVQAELGGLARTPQGVQRAADLAYLRAWLEALAFSGPPDEELFPGAPNIVPVYANLSRFALTDPAALEQAESLAAAVLQEWIAAVSGGPGTG